jgi:hypothetical protein
MTERRTDLAKIWLKRRKRCSVRLLRDHIERRTLVNSVAEFCYKTVLIVHGV